MNGHILFIQKKFKNRQVFLEAKLFMLEAYWDLVLEWLVRRGNGIKSKKVLEVAERIRDVEPKVRQHVLERLLWQNQKLANIATYRKRQLEKPDVCDMEEVDLQVFKIQSLLIQELQEFRDPMVMINKQQRDMSYIPLEQLREMGLHDVDPNPKSSFIESLTEIGWLDPFPGELAKETPKKRKISKFIKVSAALARQPKVIDYIINLEEKNSATKAVVSFALPSKAVMVKIMRACVAVSEPYLLWICK